jgi:hypothetical protein
MTCGGDSPFLLLFYIRRNPRIMVVGAFGMVSKERLVQITESSIDNLITTFKRTPYFFYTENDLHTYLYHQIYSRLPSQQWRCRTKDSRSSILLHKEYPTKERYSAKTLKEGVLKGSRGHFDLSIWNPEETSRRLFRIASSTDFEKEQHTFIAIEFDMIEGSDSFDSALHHLKWDLLKLRSTKNKIEYGYSLVFVRDWLRRGNFVEKARNEAEKPQNTTVLYIEKDKSSIRAGILSPRLFLNYEPIFK